jgi:hypothetical protein
MIDAMDEIMQALHALGPKYGFRVRNASPWGDICFDEGWSGDAFIGAINRDLARHGLRIVDYEEVIRRRSGYRTVRAMCKIRFL